MNYTNLDAEELLHLAIDATGEGRHEVAVSCLKQALEMTPDDARVIYLLAAEHAQLRMFDRAMQGMARALELAPELAIARLQLGLLYLSFDRIDETVAVWQALDELADNEPLKLFKQGLSALIREDYDSCERSLRSGIELNRSNPALNTDMQRILNEMHSYREASLTLPVASINASNEGQAGEVHPLFLSAYQDNLNHQ